MRDNIFTIEVAVPGESDPLIVAVRAPDGDMSKCEISPYTLWGNMTAASEVLNLLRSIPHLTKLK